MTTRPEFFAILRLLAEREVESVVVGGVAAVLMGAPISTFDLDLVYSLEEENRRRLGGALEELEAIYRDPAGRRIEPTAARLAGGGHHQLLTRHGPLDLLGSIGAGQSYEELLPKTSPFEVGGIEVKVLELAAVIETKEHAAREKDRATLEILRETLRLKGGGGT